MAFVYPQFYDYLGFSDARKVSARKIIRAGKVNTHELIVDPATLQETIRG